MALTYLNKDVKNLFTANNPAEIKIATDSISGSFFRIIIYILYKEDDNFILIGIDSAEPDVFGIALFDLSAYLQAIFQQHKYIHNFETDFKKTKGDAACKIFFDHKYYNESEIANTKNICQVCLSLYTENTFYCHVCGAPRISNKNEAVIYTIDAKLSDIDFKTLKIEKKNFHDVYFNKTTFLTNQPRTKLISYNQPEKLYFYISPYHESFVGFDVDIKVIYKDNTSINITKESSESEYGIYCLKTNYYELKLNEIDSVANPIISYTVNSVKLSKTTNILNDSFTYVIDKTESEFERFVIFKNNLGGYDCIRCTGLKTINEKYKYIIAGSYNRTKSNIDSTEILTLDTGLVSPKYNEYLSEIYHSSEVYELENDRLFSIVIQNKETLKWKDNQFLFSKQFEYLRDVYQVVEDTTGTPVPVGGLAKFACSLVQCEQIEDEVIIEIQVSNISDFDGQTYLIFDFGDKFANGEEYELNDVSYFYYNNSEIINDDSGYIKEDLDPGSNQIIINLPSERALFIHYYIENINENTVTGTQNEPEIKRFEAGKIIIIHDDVNAHIPQCQRSKNDAKYLLDNIDFSVELLDTQIQLTVHVLSDPGNLSFFYKIIK